MTYEGIQRFIESQSPKWVRRLGLSHFTVKHVFLDSYYGDDGEEDFKVTAVTETRWNYLQAKVKWYLPSCARHSREVLEKTLVHELCHVLLSAEQDLIDDAVDRSADALALAQAQRDQLSAQFYERMELATEQVALALWKAHRG